MANNTVDEDRLIEKYQPLSSTADILRLLNEAIVFAKFERPFDYAKLPPHVLCGFIIGVGASTETGIAARKVLNEKLASMLKEVESED